ncbi:hypothetical protein EEW87_004270 [Janibacter melonis]|uniref:Uncharacterized protein n=1 Tax=Janibacter melonis TaxID=262209 RepID=A0A5P8FLB2_9MICO|nr:hypothetical protein [Janibacter melonis]QFQ29714.1 hypothetical protein EEW87_004270 [Janibacter melonis]
MPRLRNEANGVVVNVDTETAARLVGSWTDLESTSKPTPKRAAKKAAAAPSGDADGSEDN